MQKTAFVSKFSLWISLFLCGMIHFARDSKSLAQIIPDNTLGKENSIVKQINPKLKHLEGGAIRGQNLFHSFLEFNIQQNSSAYFANPQGISNIFSRVTGNNVSQILGTLGVLGDANLFLVNPNGIMFGANVQLDITGSFVASSGSSFLFPNDMEFSATNPQAPPLLTVNATAPIGIRLEGSEGIITNQGKLNTGNNLTLAGDQVINEGLLTSTNGTINLLQNAINIESKNLSSLTFNNRISTLANKELQADNSLGTENTRIQNVSNDRDRVIGGAQRGRNLFHSFTDFNVDRNKKVAFFTPIDVENIIARVTGNDISNIDGRLVVQGGEANLFLLNPNGIIFGEDAALNLSASFVVSTAESLVFQDNTVFSSNLNNTSSLLSITKPTGLNFGNKVGDITNLSFSNNFFGLIIPTDNTITLLGGDIEFDGGIISADEARVEIGALAPNSFVEITQDKFGWQPVYQGNEQFKDINFNRSAFVSSFGDFGGDIRLQGKNINLTKGSQLVSVAFDSSAGKMIINASESVTVSGTDGFFSSGFFNEVEGTATGKGKKLNINTKNLIIANGGQISTTNFGEKQGVNLQIKVSELIEIKNGGFVIDEITRSGIKRERIPSGIFSRANASGKGGKIDLQTQTLIILGGGQISVSTFGRGDGGNLNIISNESITIAGQDIKADNRNPSGLFAQVEGEGTGDGGRINIITAQLTALDGAQISATARNTGSGGDIIVNVNDTILLSGIGELARSIDSSGIFVSVNESDFGDASTGNGGSLELTASELIVEKGAQISADTFSLGDVGEVNLNISRLKVLDRGRIGAGSLILDDAVGSERGDGGTLSINAKELVEVRGNSQIGKNIVRSSIFTRAEGTGKAGNLNIITPNLIVADGGSVDVSAAGTGEAGSLFISSQDLNLDAGSLTAETRKGDQGNISITDGNLLLLQNNSEITTNASKEATGGNININADLILASENSDITANAFIGNGGSISINSQTILGIEPRSELTFLSDITASSELGIDGIIEINRLNVDPVEGFRDLPFAPVEVQIVQGCDASGKGNIAFYDLGKGGLIAQPEDFIRIKQIPWNQLTITQSTENSQLLVPNAQSSSTYRNPLETHFSCLQ